MPASIGKSWRGALSNQSRLTIPAGKVVAWFEPQTFPAGVETVGTPIAVIAVGDNSAAAGAIARGAFAVGVTIDNSSTGAIGGRIYLTIDMATVTTGVGGFVLFVIQNQDGTTSAWPDNTTTKAPGKVWISPGVVSTVNFPI
jgi:hypothetical protein